MPVLAVVFTFGSTPMRRYRGGVTTPGTLTPRSLLHHELTTLTIPIFSPFLFIASLYAILSLIRRIFDLLVSSHFYMFHTYKRLRLLFVGGCHGNDYAYQVSSPSILLLGSLRSEEVILKKIA